MPATQTGAFPYPSQRVVVMRHGERRDSAPDAPAESNPPLTEAGVAAVQSAAARLRHYLGEEAASNAVLVVSPFLRTVQTAEALQHHGIGVAQAMVIDNTLCEVFGPSRIKTSRAPQLAAQPASSAIGGLPQWGESIESATERYVTSFLRNGDVYGGPLSANRTPSSDVSSGAMQEDSQVQQSMVVPAAVTNRAKSRLPPRNLVTRGSTKRKASDSIAARSEAPRDVVLVTHGDAISAIVSHFYPARVVYEADFLSFLIMRRYGPGNPVYHLDESAGVNWFVDGIDREPEDTILFAMEKQRLAAARGANSGSRGYANGADEDDPDGEDDSAEFDLDDPDANGSLVPVSFASNRQRRSGAAAVANRQRVAPLAVGHVTNPFAPPVRPHNGSMGGAAEESARVVRTPRQGSVSSQGPTTPLGGHHQRHRMPHHTPAAPATADSPGVSRDDPKAGEGCDRIRLPTGTPAQSSSNAVITLSYGHSAARGAETDTASIGGGGGDDSSDQSSCETSSPVAAVRSLPLEQAHDQAGSHGSTRDWDGEEGGTSVRKRLGPPGEADQDSMQQRGSSGYGGLTDEASGASWGQPKIAYPSSHSVACGVRVQQQQLQPVTCARARMPVRASYGSAASASETPSRAETAVFASYEVAPVAFVHGHFSEGVVSTSRISDVTDDSTTSLHHRIERQRDIISAAYVSYGLRGVAGLLIMVEVAVLEENAATMWFGVCAVAWEAAFSVALHLSCRPEGWRARRVRCALEQFRLDHGWCLVHKGTAAPRAATAVVVHDLQDEPAANAAVMAARAADEQAAPWRGGIAGVVPVPGPGSGESCVSVRGVLRYVRLGVALVVKLAIIDLIAFVLAVLFGSSVEDTMAGADDVFEPGLGLGLFLVYAGVCVARGVWDETKLDAALGYS